MYIVQTDNALYGDMVVVEEDEDVAGGIGSVGLVMHIATQNLSIAHSVTTPAQQRVISDNTFVRKAFSCD